MLYIQNDVYYTVREAAKLAKVPERTLRRWLASGELTHFLYPFQRDVGPMLLRLRPPTKEEVLLMEEKQIYRLPGEGTEHPLPEAFEQDFEEIMEEAGPDVEEQSDDRAEPEDPPHPTIRRSAHQYRSLAGGAV